VFSTGTSVARFERLWRAAAIAPLALLLAVVPALATAPDPFPEPETIRPNVEFWIRVFGEWGVGQVVVHDAAHPALQYEVIALPGATDVAYTGEQRRLVDDLRGRWQDWLLAFEAKVERGDPLDDLEREWLDYIDVTVGREALAGAHARVRTQRGLRERFRAGLERSTRYLEDMREILRDAGLPEDLAYLPHVESSFVAHARSSAGAVGLWQFTHGAGRRYLKVTSTVDERLDPIAATRGAAAYLRDAFARLESWPLAVTSYNHGVEGMARAKQEFGTDFGAIYRGYASRSFGFASRNFYAEFLAVRRIASDPGRWFPEGWNPEPPADDEWIVLDSDRTAAAIARAYGVDHATLISQNPAWNRRAVDRSHRIPAGTAVWLPRGTLERVDPAVVAAAWASDTGPRTYVVKSGDTLSRIAQAHGLTLAELRDLNDIARGSSMLRVGQKLVVGAGRAGASRDVHVVRRGDTLREIALRYGVKLIDLLAENSLSASTVIHPGQSLRIPGR
jgi:membrane-bound lytic murein transglycosylase D